MLESKERVSGGLRAHTVSDLLSTHERWEAGGGLRWELAASSSIFSLLWAEALDHAAGPGEGRDPSTP